jgi:predicted DNA-binding protein with PD1-like motif
MERVKQDPWKSAVARGAWLALLMLFTPSCATLDRAGRARTFVVRLRPGQELKTELMALAREQGLEAASVTSAVGSLTDVALRLANKDETTRWQGHFEVVSLSGYLSAGEFHLHMAVSDGEGRTTGGHVMEGNRVYTTLVVSIEEHLDLRYRRAFDPASGYDELVIERR